MITPRPDPTPPPHKALPCPECRQRGLQGDARIGNRRGRCTTCNNFAQNVRRLTLKRLMDQHRDDYYKIRARVEYDLYPQVMESWVKDHPLTAGAMPEVRL